MTGLATNKKPDPIVGKDLPVECPKCGKVIRKNRVDVRRFNWGAFEVLGLFWLPFSLFFPQETIEYQCEHCGKIFPIPRAIEKRWDRCVSAINWLLNIAVGLYFLWLMFFHNQK